MGNPKNYIAASALPKTMVAAKVHEISQHDGRKDAAAQGSVRVAQEPARASPGQ
jgi:hypothetical protein